MRTIGHMALKEFRQVFRDTNMVRIIFIIPVIQLLVLSYAITTEVKHIQLAITDLDRSSTSRSLIRAFEHTDRFDVLGALPDMRTIRSYMQAWQVQMALVIPPGFERELHTRHMPQLQIITDGVDGNSAGVALGYAQGIIADWGAHSAVLLPPPVLRRTPPRAIMEERMWYNPDLSSTQYIVPGIVVVLLTILPMMLSSISLVKEKEIGTLEQLMVTPIKKHQLILGKLVPFLALSYVELAIVMAVAVTVFGITMNGSYLLLAFLSFLYIFTTLGLGIFVSTITHSQQQAMFLSWFFMIFMILLSGFFIPIENMPPALQNLTYLNPMRYFMYMLRDVFQKGSSLEYLLHDAGPMTLFGLLIFSFSVLKFQKHVA